MKKVIWIVLLSVSGLWNVHAFAIDAGWINHFDGKPENYLIKRGNETISAGVFTVLQVGDEISVSDKRHHIELSLRGGIEQAIVTYSNSPFKIDKASQVSKGELWMWIKQCLNGWHELTQQMSDEADNSDSKEIIMPLLENLKNQAVLIAGKRPLYLQWYGSNPPYQVQVKQSGRRGKVLLTQETFDSVIETTPLTFEINKSYRVVISDASAQKFTGGFIAIAPADMPNYLIPSQDSLPDDLRHILEATWLAMQKEQDVKGQWFFSGQWFFEAYQQAAGIINYRPAQLLKDALAQGLEKIVRRGVRG
jgi:hypothetical protein